MADSFGLKIGLEGEKEFKKALADINQSFKVLGSEMKLVSSQFDKNDKSVQALSARNSVLNKEIEAQKSKIETLRAALQNASDSFGETDRRTQNWQIQLNNAEAALNDMERELSDNNAALEEANANYDRAGDALEDMDSEMDDVTDSADDMGDEIDEAGDAAEKSESKFKSLGTVLKTVGAAMGAVVIAAGAAAVKLGKEVIDAYADYEQLVGGVDTLFKESSQELQTYAANAYKTAGMSANDYMETVTGFSASLIQSLGGDTEKAVKYADMAITDMSDNANKMGTDMTAIQNAYQGFAKQNYTMLDNLKLGYGGTKEEMERLLADAQAISGIEYDISSYADVVDAIHVIQTSMDITGTTAKEAEHTISGSINSMQAAIQNLIVGFGDANADIGMLCGNVVNAFQDVLTNITPVIENIIAALPTALNALIATVGELLPTILETVVSLFTEVLTTILNLLPTLIPAAVQAVMTIVNALIENLPLLIEAAIQLVATLVQGIADALPTLIPAAVEAVVTIVQGLADNLPMLLDAALQLITGLAQGLLDALPVLIAALPEIITAIVDFIIDSIPQIIAAIVKGFASGVSQMASIGLNLIKGIWNGISDAASWLWSKVSGFCSNLMSKIKGFFGIHSPSKEMVWIGDMLTQGLANGIDESAKVAVNAAQSLNEGIMGVMDSLADDMQTAVPSSFNLDADATVRSAASGVLGKAASAFTIALNITNFNNYSSEDIRQLTNEVMETANQFAQRKRSGIRMTSFTYNGRSSADFGLHIQSKNVFSAPEYDAEFISVPGRSGDIINPNRRFANIKVTYTVFLARKNTAALATTLRDIKGWLYSEPDRYHELTDSYDAEYFRYSVISDNLDIEEQMNKVGSFTVTFNCKPYKYSFEGQQTVAADDSTLTVTNPAAFESRPYIKLYGSGAVTLNISSGGSTNSWTISAIDEYIEIDSELMNCYKDTVLKNDTVTGDSFPAFKPETATISCVGTVTRIEVIPRWCCL